MLSRTTTAENLKQRIDPGIGQQCYKNRPFALKAWHVRAGAAEQGTG
jgi:hypothetical protein